jgi:hypothetical protein
MWHWLTHPKEPYTWGFIIRVLIKATVLFIVLNILFAFLRPMDFISRLSLYNGLVDGRVRLPYADENPAQSYSLTINNIPAMVSSHQIARPKADDEFRVIILGNSAIWGFWLTPNETIAPQLNEMGYLLADNKRVVMYNLAYPFPYSVRDLLVLDEVMQYQPDMVIWVMTMGSLYSPFQFDVVVAHNPDRVRHLIDGYGLDLDPNDSRFISTDFYSQTIINQRRELTEWLRLQLYGMMWGATGIDHIIKPYVLNSNDVEDKLSWGIFDPATQFTADDLFFNVIDVGYRLVGDIPLILINQPMFIATGVNSDLRYNSGYPRWVFDLYRELFSGLATEKLWLYCDLWDALPNEFFTDTPFHMTPEGMRNFSRIMGEMITNYLDYGYLGQDCE